MNSFRDRLPNLDQFSKPYFFFSNNLASEILFASRSVEEVLGYRPQDLIGRKYTFFLQEEHPLNRSVEEFRQRRFSGDGPNNQLRAVVAADKQVKLISIQTYGDRNSEGKVVANHAIAKDVTNIFLVEQEFHFRMLQLEAIKATLTDREVTVLNHVASGILNKTIAKKLSLSARSIEHIRSRLVKKFGVSSIAEVITQATELKMFNKLIRLVEA